jgi:hypothetical protein
VSNPTNSRTCTRFQLALATIPSVRRSGSQSLRSNPPNSGWARDSRLVVRIGLESGRHVMSYVSPLATPTEMSAVAATPTRASLASKLLHQRDRCGVILACLWTRSPLMHSIWLPRIERPPAYNLIIAVALRTFLRSAGQRGLTSASRSANSSSAHCLTA